MLEKLKEELVQLHLELPKNNLVVWTGGNVSARDPETGLVVIKASGITFDERFLLQTEDGMRTHQVRLQGGDASSDSFCYA